MAYPGMMRQIGILLAQNYVVEVIYLLIVIALCLIIYFRTKDMYDLTGHKGIKYFRSAFLFLALAYFLRFAIQFFEFTTLSFEPTRITALFSFLLFGYTSSMAILSLAYSTIWKKLEASKIFSNTAVQHLPAIILPITVILTRSTLIFILTQAALFMFAIVMSFVGRRKKGLSFHIIYTVLFMFWILNLIAVTTPLFLLSFKVTIYLVSIILISSILYRVIVRTGS